MCNLLKTGIEIKEITESITHQKGIEFFVKHVKPFACHRNLLDT